MAMISCSKGHWYDNADFPECPYCKAANEATTPIGVGETMPVNTIGRTQPLQSATSSPSSASSSDFDMGKTVPLIREKIGIDPVVGWLVCVGGKDKGRDYRIHSENNFVGRSEKMDICIKHDETISRENHTIISYNTHNRKFYIVFSAGRSLTLLNDEPVYSTMELKPYDLIVIGETELRFVPFCGENFDWIIK
jgi:hypothetical protein